MKNLLRFLPLLILTALSALGSVSSQTARIAYTITSLPAACPTTFPFNSTATVPDLVVLDGGSGNASNSPPVTLTLNSDYTVTGGGYNSQNQLQTGTVTILGTGTHAVQVGDVITILRNVPFTQTTTFSSSGFMSPLMIESGLDKLTLQTQQLKDLFGLSLQFQKNEILSPLLGLSARESQTLGFNASGAIEYGAGGGGGGTTYFAGTGLLLSANTFSVNPVQNLTSLAVTNTITGSVTGNAATATAFQTARTINGVSFDGTGNITVPAAAGTLTGPALPITITSAPGLTSTAAGTLGTMSVQNATGVNVTGGTINGAVVTGLASPSTGTDAANKTYVDSFASGIIVRTAVLVTTTANITLSGTQTIDGVAVLATNRVLVKNQTTTSQNGIYDCAAGAWARSSDSNTAAELLVGYNYFVSQGTTQASTSWVIQTAPTVLNTDPVVFTQFSAGSTYVAGTGLNLVGNTFSILAAQPTITSLGTLTSLAASGQITSTVATGTAPLVVASTTNVPNLNASSLGGATFASPGPIGGTTPGLASFTTVSGSAGNFSNSVLVGSLRMFLSQIENYTANSTAAIAMNYDGYNSSFTQFRDINIYDGKSQPVLFITGSNKTSTFSGPLVTTTISASSNANLRTTKANLNLQVNVKDYGALGDGTTDDTAAINAAAVAVVSHGTLYFPPGKYRITAGITAFDSVTYVTITGTGAEIYNDSGASGANTFVVNNTCSNFEIGNLRFTGTATVRGSGIHIRMGASYSNIHDCTFQGCSDFAVLVSYGAGGWITGCKVSNCISYSTLGDGFHFGSVTDSSIDNCSAISTGDDGLGIVADTLANPPTRIEVIGFTAYQAGNPAGGGTHGCGIRVVDGAIDIHIVGGQSYQSAEAGLYIGRAVSTTVYNTRVVVDGFKVVAPIQAAGMLGGINCTFTNQAEFHGCRVEAPVTGCGFSFLDCNNLVVTGCTVKDAALRSFAVDDGTTTNVATNWSNWTISGNVSLGTPTNEIYYFTPASGKTLTNLLITGNTETGCSATNYIFTNRLAGTCKIITNTSLGGKAIANGGSGIVPTATPNY